MPACPVKDALVDIYRRNGFDFVTACQFATEFIRDLNREPPGTVWTLNDVAGRRAIAVKRA